MKQLEVRGNFVWQQQDDWVRYGFNLTCVGTKLLILRDGIIRWSFGDKLEVGQSVYDLDGQLSYKHGDRVGQIYKVERGNYYQVELKF